MKSIIKTTLLASVIALSLGACSSTTISGISGNNRSQLMLVSSDEVNKKAGMAYADVIREAKAHGILNTNKKQAQRVTKIANKLIAKAPYFRADCKSWDWEVNVITSKELNAWCMPGGKIAVYTGIIDTLKLTDDEIAVVLGHEITHALREHSREQMSQHLIKSSALGIASLFVDQRLIVASNALADLGLMLPFSRAHEIEADEIGLELVHKAGYNVDAGPSVWQKMAKLNTAGKPLEILSTHPSDESRIENLERLAKAIKSSKSE